MPLIIMITMIVYIIMIIIMMIIIIGMIDVIYRTATLNIYLGIITYSVSHYMILYDATLCYIGSRGEFINT